MLHYGGSVVKVQYTDTRRLTVADVALKIVSLSPSHGIYGTSATFDVLRFWSTLLIYFVYIVNTLSTLFNLKIKCVTNVCRNI